VIDTVDCLGLVLAWTQTRGSMVVLLFGLTMTNLSTYLQFGHAVVIEVLKNDSKCNNMHKQLQANMLVWVRRMSGVHDSGAVL
jgi:hypothetical protein